MLEFIALLLAVWLALAFLGAVVDGLAWLVVVATVLFVVTTLVGLIRMSGGPRTR